MTDPCVTGKYVGNRPIKLKKADTNVRPVEIGHKKAKQLEKDLKKNRKKLLKKTRKWWLRV